MKKTQLYLFVEHWIIYGLPIWKHALVVAVSSISVDPVWITLVWLYWVSKYHIPLAAWISAILREIIFTKGQNNFRAIFRFLSICFLYSNVSYLSPTCAVVMRLYRFHINELIIVGTRCIFCSITSTKVITINFSIAHELICIKMHQIGAS